MLLSSFAWLNETGEEDNDKPKKTRLQRLIEWSKKIKKKKKGLTSKDEEKEKESPCQPQNQENIEIDNNTYPAVAETMV